MTTWNKRQIITSSQEVASMPFMHGNKQLLKIILDFITRHSSKSFNKNKHKDRQLDISSIIITNKKGNAD